MFAKMDRAKGKQVQMQAQTPAQAKQQIRQFVSGLRKKARALESSAKQSEKRGLKKTASAMRNCAKADRGLANALESDMKQM